MRRPEAARAAVERIGGHLRELSGRGGSPIDADSSLLRSLTSSRSGAATGAAAASVAMTYFLDPDSGRRRRARIRDKAAHRVNVLRNTVDKAGRDTANRARGSVREARGLVTSEEIDDELIVERVRSRLGQLATHPSSIEVEASDGAVTLSGPIPAREQRRLMRGVRRVKGVGAVQNRLDVHEQSDGIPGLQGGGRIPAKPGESWSPSARVLATAAGASLLYLAARRRDPAGAASAVSGAALTARGLFNLPLRRLTGLGSKRRGIDIQKTINIDAPVGTVFDFWKSYETFPKFMTHVQDVKPIDDNRSRWIVDGPAGTSITFDTEVSTFEENRRIGWRTAEGTAIGHAGIVRFSENPDGSARVQLQMTYNPVAGGLGHSINKLLGSDPRRRIDDDLLRMKSLIETGQRPSDAAQP